VLWTRELLLWPGNVQQCLGPPARSVVTVLTELSSLPCASQCIVPSLPQNRDFEYRCKTMTGHMFYSKNLLQLHTMENEWDISFASQHIIMALLYYRSKLTTLVEIICVIIQNVNSGSVFWKAIECFDGLVSWSSPVCPLGFRCSGRTIKASSLCVSQQLYWCDCSYTVHEEHGAFKSMVPVFSNLNASHI
jgi:hypothetical protein